MATSPERSGVNSPCGLLKTVRSNDPRWGGVRILQAALEWWDTLESDHLTFLLGLRETMAQWLGP